jgi:hypothetical protein
MPNDLDVEAWDCLRLCQTMKKHASEEYVVPDSLSPHEALPDVIM